MEQQQLQRYLAEFFGTFVLVFMGTTSVVGALRFTVNPLLVAPFAFGLALLAGLYAFAEVSGGHFNPRSRSGSTSTRGSAPRSSSATGSPSSSAGSSARSSC
jgi:glycerol uptake facilitator-like aquaporin